MRTDFVESYDFFIKKLGICSQRLMCIEEMSELTKELCKLERYKGTEKEQDIINNIREEIADVLNTVEELEHYYGYKEIEFIRENKINRALNKLNK